MLKGLKKVTEWMMLISFISFIVFLILTVKLLNGELAIWSGISVMVCIVTSLITTINNKH